MLIGICGQSLSGKNEIARYLLLQGFTRLYIQSRETPKTHSPPDAVRDPAQNQNQIEAGSQKENGSADELAFSKNSRFERESSALSDIDSSEDQGSSHVVFNSAEELLEYVTKRWREKFVTTNIHTLDTLETLSTRPFFLLLAVQAPVTVRYQRYLTNMKTAKTQLSFEDFTAQSDTEMYAGSNALAPIMHKATLHILNVSQSLELLYLRLSNLNLTDESRLRPSWDAYFMQLSNLAARRSNCMKRRVGCVIARGKRVISTGYNGTPRGITNCNEGGCARCNDGGVDGSNLGTCLCLHAEENALLESGRERIGDDSVLYCNTCPCLTCSIKIVQMGLTEVVYSRSYSMDEKSFKVLSEGGVKVRQYWPPEEGTILI
ncbi:deoxycytidylate deaminase [Myxozyma melibiosi]|uniref:dCMP deaminase n=1 Tax=Myxozyma melibiosi TaxID=54550 RepID=A0ABR1F448_9ASCO